MVISEVPDVTMMTVPEVNGMNKNRLRSFVYLLIFMHFIDPFAYKTTVEGEARIKDRDPRDPNQAPKPGKGDSYLLGATFLGIIIGGIAGFLIAYHGFGNHMVVLGIFGGILAGGLAGIAVGSRLKKKKQQEANDGPNAGI